MEEEWLRWLRENHPEHYKSAEASLRWQVEWRDKEIERLKRGPCCKEPDYCGGECGCEICATEAHIADLKARIKDLLMSSPARHAFCKAPCGHSSQYCWTDDGGKHIVCLLCEYKKVEAR